MSSPLTSRWLSRQRLLVLVPILALVLGYLALAASGVMTEAELREHAKTLVAYKDEYPFYASLMYCVAFMLVAGLAIPGAWILTPAAGAIFGLWWGLALMLSSASIGALLSFWLSRYFMRDFVVHRYGRHLQAINEGFRRDGAYYVIFLRLVQVPFFLVNLSMGLTPMSAMTFYWASLLGLIPKSFIFVNIGSQLAQVSSLREVFTPQMALAFALLGLLVLVSRRLADGLLRWHRRRRDQPP